MCGSAAERTSSRAGTEARGGQRSSGDGASASRGPRCPPSRPAPPREGPAGSQPSVPVPVGLRRPRTPRQNSAGDAGPAPQLCGASPRLTLDERDRGRAGRQHLGHARQRRGLAVVECVRAGEVAGELQGRPGAGRRAGHGRRDEARSASSLAAPGGRRRPRGKRPMKPRHAGAPRPPARPVNRHPRGAPRVGAMYYPM